MELKIGREVREEVQEGMRSMKLLDKSRERSWGKV